MAERLHVVRQGECMASIALMYGFQDWREIYDDPANEGLRQLRSDPHVLAPGDLVTIPEPPPPQTHSLRQGESLRLRGGPPRVALKLKLERAPGQPLAGVRYELAAGLDDFEGTTGSAGEVEHMVSATVTTATLCLFPDSAHPEVTRTVTLWIGHLDPIDSESGVRSRLANLGYLSPNDCDPPRPGRDDDQGGGGDPNAGDASLTFAVRALQRECGLAETGVIDDATRSKLRDKHGA
jgi:hypothetical protein